MKRCVHAVLVLSLSLCFSSSLFAWNYLGHMVIASIAYQNLKPPVKKKVDELISYFQKEYPYMDSFVQIAHWPDRIRMQHIEMFDHWHYIDMPFSDDGTPIKNTVDTDNAVWALDKIKIITKNDKANAYERARFLGFFIHIVGDLHQPLHTVSRISAENPNGDAGGNLFYIRYKGKRIKLHKLWDEGLGLFLGEDNAKHANMVADEISALYPRSYFGNKINEVNPEEWVKEGMKNARSYVYTTPSESTPTSGYVAAGQQLVQQSVALAGYRAANMLNQMLG